MPRRAICPSHGPLLLSSRWLPWRGSQYARVCEATAPGFQGPVHTSTSGLVGDLPVCMQPYNTHGCSRTLCHALEISSEPPSTALVSSRLLPSSVCDNDLEIPHSSGVCVVSDTKLCRPNHSETAGLSSCHSDDRTGYLLHLLSFLLPDGTHIHTGI